MFLIPEPFFLRQKKILDTTESMTRSLLFLLSFCFLVSCSSQGEHPFEKQEKRLYLIHAKKGVFEYHKTRGKYAELILGDVSHSVTFFLVKGNVMREQCL